MRVNYYTSSRNHTDVEVISFLFLLFFLFANFCPVVHLTPTVAAHAVLACWCASSLLHQVTNRLESGVGSASVVSTGAVSVVSRVWGWRKHWFGGSQVADMGALSLPPLEYSTRAVWIDVPPEVQLPSHSLLLFFKHFDDPCSCIK